MARTDDALNFLRDYAKDHPQAVEVQANLGQLMQNHGLLEEARQIFLKLLDIDKSNVEWLTREAEVLYEMGELDDALLYYDQIYEINRDDIAANLGFLRIHISKKNYEKAKPFLDFLKEEHSDIYDLNVLAGLYYQENNNHDKARYYFERAIEIDSSRALPYYQLGLLLVQKGDFGQACDNWKKALLLSPDEELAKKIRQCLKITVELCELIKQQV